MKQSKTTKKLLAFISNLQTYYHAKLDLQKVDQHTGGKWLIHGSKRHKDNQFKKNVQGRKYPGSCAFAEPELLR